MMLGFLLALGLASCKKDPTPARMLEIEALLPLTGPLSPAGAAFAEGLSQGAKAQSSDSLHLVVTMLDNASRADSTVQLLLQARKEIVVAGLGAAASELPARSGASLWVGQDGEPPSGWASLSASSSEQADSLLNWCRRAPRPLAIVFSATGQWSPLVQEHLAPRLDSVVLIPHDGGETTWNREATRLLVTRPASILLWHGLDQARTLLGRKDLEPLLAKAHLLGPEGCSAPQTWGPVWESSQSPDSQELARWKHLGSLAAARLSPAWRGPKTLPLTVRATP